MSSPIAIVGQSLRVNAAFGADLAGASSVVIKYRTPAAVTGEVAATVTDESIGVVYADIPAATLTVAGSWAFWGSATLADARVVKTYGASVDVLAEGTVVTGATCG